MDIIITIYLNNNNT